MLTKIKQLKRSKYILKICSHSNRIMQPKDKITLTNFIGALTLKLLENKNKLKVAGVTCSKSTLFGRIYRPRLVFSIDANTLLLASNALFGKYIFRHEKEASIQWYYDL